MRKRLLLVETIMILGILIVCVEQISAQVPITVWGYVYMPDGSKAVGASVTVVAGGISKSTTTDSSGKYKVDLTVASVPVTVKVTAKKGEYKGSASKSGVEGVVQIDVHLKKPSPPPPPPPPPKEKTTLTLQTPKDEYIVGDLVEVYGTIKPAMKVNIDIVITSPNGTKLKTSIQTMKNGSFSYEFRVDTIGVWKIYAIFAGNEKYKSSRSNTIKLRVKQLATIEISVLPAGPRQFTITGSINPPVAYVTVFIYVSLDGGKTWLLMCNTTTDKEGCFRIDLNTTVSGWLMFKATFPGTETLSYAETERPPMFKLVSEEEQRLKQEVEELTRELEAAKSRIEELEKNLKKANERAEELERKLKEAHNKTKELESLLEETKSEVTRLSNELEEANSEITRLNSEVILYRNLTFVLPILLLFIGVVIGYFLRKQGSRVHKDTETHN